MLYKLEYSEFVSLEEMHCTIYLLSPRESVSVMNCIFSKCFTTECSNSPFKIRIRKCKKCFNYKTM